MPRLALLEAARALLVKDEKKEEGKEEESKGVKRELPSGSQVSPSKKMATEIDKKLKCLKGDTSLIKETMVND